LFPVAECRVEYADVVRVGDGVGDVGGAGFAGGGCGCEEGGDELSVGFLAGEEGAGGEGVCGGEEEGEEDGGFDEEFHGADIVLRSCRSRVLMTFTNELAAVVNWRFSGFR